MGPQKADWSELYTDLLITIATIASHLETRDDFRHFRSVCKHWRSSSSIFFDQNLPYLSTLFPQELSSTPKPFTKPSSFRLIIVANSTLLLQPKNPNPNPNHNSKLLKPWLITVEELARGTLCLRKPLTRNIIKEFPDNLPMSLNFSNCKVIEIRRDYNLRYAEESPCHHSRWKQFTHKVVLFFNPSSVTPSRNNDCFALAIIAGELLFVGLNNEKNFGFLHPISKFDDIVNYKGCVWAIDRKCMAYVVHYSEDNLKLVRLSDGVCTGDTQKRLVESSEGLYLIDMYDDRGLIKFKVYKLNEYDFGW